MRRYQAPYTYPHCTQCPVIALSDITKLSELLALMRSNPALIIKEYTTHYSRKTRTLWTIGLPNAEIERVISNPVMSALNKKGVWWQAMKVTRRDSLGRASATHYFHNQ